MELICKLLRRFFLYHSYHVIDRLVNVSQSIQKILKLFEKHRHQMNDL